MNTRDIADKMAREDFNTLNSFLITRGVIRNNPISEKLQIEKKAITCLTQSFAFVAEKYFEKIESILKDEKDIKRKNFEYYKVLKELKQHMQWPISIASAYTTRLTHKAHFEESWDVLDIIEKIIDCISTRFLTQPLFIPLIAEDFKNVEFNYMPSGIVVIGIPPFALSLLPRHLGVIWHEVGGYAVAVLKRQAKFKDCIEQLSKPLYTELETCYHNSVELKARKDDWCETWLGEFFEDLFGVQALEGTMIEALGNALTRIYDDFDRGDEEHPPPKLRLQVALAFLSKSKRSETLHKLKYLGLNEQVGELPGKIVEVYKKNIKYVCDRNSSASPKEKDVIDIILANSEDLLGAADRAKAIQEKIRIKNLPHKNISELCDRYFALVNELYRKNISDVSTIKSRLEKEYGASITSLLKLIETIDQAKKLDTLLDMQFIKINKAGEGGYNPEYPGGYNPPYPGNDSMEVPIDGSLGDPNSGFIGLPIGSFPGGSGIIPGPGNS